jgi:hypothetical protein
MPSGFDKYSQRSPCGMAAFCPDATSPVSAMEIRTGAILLTDGNSL